MNASKLTPGEIYAAAVATIPAEHIDHHNSDLYLRRTPETTAIIKRLENRALLSTFQDSNGVVWYEIGKTPKNTHKTRTGPTWAGFLYALEPIRGYFYARKPAAAVKAPESAHNRAAPGGI